MARIRTGILLTLSMALLLAAVPALAGPAPSKSAEAQSVLAREADLATVRAAAGLEQVAAALRAQGFTSEQIDRRLAELSNDDLRALARNVEHIQAAGLTSEEWMWIGVGALAVLLLLILLD